MAVELNGQIVAHQDTLAEGHRAFHKVVKRRMEFGGAAGDIQGFDLRMAFENLQAFLDSGVGKRFRACWLSVDVAMTAGLVAQLGDIDLERVYAQRSKVDIVSAQLRLEIVLRWCCFIYGYGCGFQRTSFFR